jgi:hypothetical protein
MGRKSGTAGTQRRSGVSHSAGAAAAETETISFLRTSAGSAVAPWSIDKFRRTSGFSLPLQVWTMVPDYVATVPENDVLERSTEYTQSGDCRFLASHHDGNISPSW